MGMPYGFDENKNKIPMTPPQNDIVNGDFQINRRGRTSYDFNKNGEYGIDCWQHRQGDYYGAIVIEPLEGGGIKTTLNAKTGAGFRQYVKKDSSVVGKKRTVLINVDNKEYSGTVTLSKSVQSAIENDIFKLEVWYEDTTQSIVYSLWYARDVIKYPESETHNVYYACMWEGSTKYKHQKEDYTTALMRCVAIEKEILLWEGTLTKGQSAIIDGLNNFDSIKLFITNIGEIHVKRDYDGRCNGVKNSKVNGSENYFFSFANIIVNQENNNLINDGCYYTAVQNVTALPTKSESITKIWGVS